VGVEVAGALPLVVVLFGAQLHAYHGSSLLSLCFLVFSISLGSARCAQSYAQEHVKHVFVLSGFKSQMINEIQVGDHS